MAKKTIDYPKTVIDPVIAEVHRHKQEIGEAFGFDVVALGRSLQQREIGDPRFKIPGGEEDGGGQLTACITPSASTLLSGQELQYEQP